MLHLDSLTYKLDESDYSNREIHYLQSQNGNLYSTKYFNDTPCQEPESSEFEALRVDVPSEISWCSEAFGMVHLFHQGDSRI